MPIFSIIWIVDLGNMIAVINRTKVTILIIVTIIITIAVNYKKEGVMFVAKKIIALINIQTMSNRRQKNFGDKTENFIEIKVNIIHFWLIMKGIPKMTLIMSM